MDAGRRDSSLARAVLGAVREPVLVLDGERVASANPAAVSAFGRDPVGATLGDLLHGDGVVDLGTRRFRVHVTRGEAAVVVLEELRPPPTMEAVGRLAGGVAHELNNLLTAVEGHARILLDDLPPDAPPREDAQRILDAGERAAALTRQLLAFGRQQVLNARPVDVAEALRELEPALRSLVPARLTLRVESAPVVARVDPGQLQRVVLDLVVHAASTTPDGGTVTVTADAVSLAPADAGAVPWHVEPGDYVRLAVHDTGPGLPPELLARVFEPFAVGSGLGLAPVYGIVKQSGGHVFAEAAPAGGTVFRVLLPRAIAPATPDAPRPHAATRGGVVLLVEDDFAVRALARRVLERAGYTVLLAAHGGEALDVVEARAGTVDLVLSDVVMPVLGGVELAERLRERWPTLRVALMSAWSEAELRGEVRDKGVAFLAKPFTPESLVAVVADALATSREA